MNTPGTNLPTRAVPGRDSSTGLESNGLWAQLEQQIESMDVALDAASSPIEFDGGSSLCLAPEATYSTGLEQPMGHSGFEPSTETPCDSSQKKPVQSEACLEEQVDRKEVPPFSDSASTKSQASTGPVFVKPNPDLPTPTIDWNALPPDGSDEALTRLLAAVGGCFRAHVFVGQVSMTGQPTRVASTDAIWASMKKKPLWLKNMIMEAAQASRPLGSAPASGMMTAVMLQANHQLGCKHVFGLGLNAGEGLPKYGIVLAQDLQTPDEEMACGVAQLIALQPALQNWFACWHRNLVGRAWIRRKSKSLEMVRTNPKAIALGIAVLIGAMWLPLPYWPKRECILEPTVRQYVSSPIAGRVLSAEVRPGDTVRSGQALARLDDEQLRWDLSTAEAEKEAAAKKRDTALANRLAGNMRVAQLELEQIEVRIDSIQSNLQRLHVTSPIDGVVLQGEWFRSPGAPVNRGDCLFEIAPLEKMTVEAHIHTEDLGQIHVGDHVTLRVDSASDRVWEGEIQRIDPRAKVVEEEVVFVAEVEVADPGEALRPGMKGTVTISAGTRTVGWLLFSRPYQWVMKKLLW